jgi:hypothetical protein
MASGMTPTKKLIVRTTLVTGSTLAVILGAQALVSQDLQKNTANALPTAPLVEMADQPTQQIVPTQTVISAAPNIVILRHPSQAVTPTLNNTSLQPANPAPVRHQSASAAIQPPAPVVVQVQPQTIIQSSGSSAPMPATRPSR